MNSYNLISIMNTYLTRFAQKHFFISPFVAMMLYLDKIDSY